MADKRYRLDFTLSDSSIKSVEFTAPQGEKGDDYVLTSADKAEIAQQAAALVPSGGGSKSFVAQADAPEDKSVLWVDVDDETTEVVPGGGSGISVTAEVGQTIIVKAVDSNGKPTEWEAADYQERTHWSEEVEVMPETTMELDPEMGFFVMQKYPFVVGEEYTVNVNGTKFTSKCVDMYGMFLLGMEQDTNDNGEVIFVPVAPFSIMSGTYPGMGDVTAVTPIEDETLTTVTISILGTVTHQIPRKYINKHLPLTIVVDYNADDASYSTTARVQTVQAAFAEGREIKGVFARSIDDIACPLSLVAYSQDGKEKEYGKQLVFRDLYIALGIILVLTPQENGTYSVTTLG